MLWQQLCAQRRQTLNFHRHLDAKVLDNSLPLHWERLCHDLPFWKKADDTMPAAMSACIESAHESLNHLTPEGDNPVHCRLAIVTGEEATVHMQDIVEDDNDELQQPAAQQQGTQNVQQHLNLVGNNRFRLFMTKMAQQNALFHCSVVKNSKGMENCQLAISQQERTLNSELCKINHNIVNPLCHAANANVLAMGNRQAAADLAELVNDGCNGKLSCPIQGLHINRGMNTLMEQATTIPQKLCKSGKRLLQVLLLPRKEIVGFDKPHGQTRRHSWQCCCQNATNAWRGQLCDKDCQQCCHRPTEWDTFSAAGLTATICQGLAAMFLVMVCSF